MADSPRPLTGEERKDAEEALKMKKQLQKAARKQAKERKRLIQHQERVDVFKRAQRYLGLRSTGPGAPPAIDTSKPVTFPFEQSPIFISVDVESYERNHSQITEIGVATLDTRDLASLAPGEDGRNWHSKIQARHFRIRENMHKINYEFVRGCPDRFEFGVSEVINERDAALYVDSCFRFPALSDMVDAERNIVLLGHDVQSDIDYLSETGLNVMDQPRMLEALDGAVLYRTWKREENTKNLGSIMNDFDIECWNPHNAGNDAVYTVQAMLAVLVRESAIRGKVGETVELDDLKKKEPGPEEEDIEI